MAIYSSTLAWRIPWTEEPGGLRPMVSQRVRHGWATNTTTVWHTCPILECVTELTSEERVKGKSTQQSSHFPLVNRCPGCVTTIHFQVCPPMGVKTGSQRLSITEILVRRSNIKQYFWSDLQSNYTCSKLVFSKVICVKGDLKWSEAGYVMFTVKGH